MSNKSRLPMWMVLAGVSAGACAADPPLRDPSLRDEDISGTQVRAVARKLPSGTYEYTYDLVSPIANKGLIVTFDIDISCALDFGQFTYPDPPDAYLGTDASADGLHVPLRGYRALTADGTVTAGSPGISTANTVYWGVHLSPGNSVIGMRVLSPAPPGPRAYQLDVGMNTFDVRPDGAGWDYDSCQSTDCAGVPWITDFQVRGMTTGPACSKTPPPEPARFDGSVDEPDIVNGLLTYSAPLVDHIQVATGVKSLPMTIYYSPDIEKDTFRVTPAYLKHLFTPQPGTSETVTIPIRPEKTRVKLEVHSTKDKEQRKDDPLDHSYKDTDVFEIRSVKSAK